jgi:hypothetical protein
MTSPGELQSNRAAPRPRSDYENVNVAAILWLHVVDREEYG